MLRSHSGRRRSSYAPQLCAAASALLLLLSVSFLHIRLSSSPFHLGLGLRSVHPDHSSGRDQLIDDADNDAFDGGADDRIDELDEQDERKFTEEDETLDGNGMDMDDDPDPEEARTHGPGGYFWDHTVGVARRSFGIGSQGRSDPWGDRFLLPSNAPPEPEDRIKIAFGSDDQPVDEDVRLKLESMKQIEDALLLKVGSGNTNSPLRDRWVRWLEGKADFLRRDRMLRSNLELLNPKNHPLLQDPDMPGTTGLTRGDRLLQRSIWKELENAPFPFLEVGGVKRVELRKTLHLEEKEKNASPESQSQSQSHLYADGRRWGYLPGLPPHLPFSEFMNQFLGRGRCPMKVFMVWNSPPWMYGVRHQRGLESILYHHKDACIVVFSETMDLDFFKDFVKDGYKVAVVMPNLDELLKDTPTHVFASVWFKWRKTKYYPIHYSELVRLAALYKYGGVYLDSDVIVLKTLSLLENSVGVEDQIAGSSVFNGAVMSFKRQSPFLMECLHEFYSTYDDTSLRWNGADLMTRVIDRLYGKGGKSHGRLDIKIEPPIVFFPISFNNITRYFVAAADEVERAEQDILLKRILNESMTFHFWNGMTSALVPEPDSLVERLLNQYCLRCLAVL